MIPGCSGVVTLGSSGVVVGGSGVMVVLGVSGVFLNRSGGVQGSFAPQCFEAFSLSVVSSCRFPIRY